MHLLEIVETRLREDSRLLAVHHHPEGDSQRRENQRQHQPEDSRPQEDNLREDSHPGDSRPQKDRLQTQRYRLRSITFRRGRMPF